MVAAQPPPGQVTLHTHAGGLAPVSHFLVASAQSASAQQLPTLGIQVLPHRVLSSGQQTVAQAFCAAHQVLPVSQHWPVGTQALVTGHHTFPAAQQSVRPARHLPTPGVPAGHWVVPDLQPQVDVAAVQARFGSLTLQSLSLQQVPAVSMMQAILAMHHRCPAAQQSL